MRDVKYVWSIVLALSAVALVGIAPGMAAEVGVTDTTIKIGVLTEMTGPFTLFGRGVKDGWTLHLEDVNARGGVHGRKIEMVFGDQQASGAKAIAAAKRLIEVDKVFMIAGGGITPATVPVIPLISESKIPFVVTITSSPKVTSPFSRYIFRPAVSPDDINAQAAVEFAWKAKGLRKIAILNGADEYGKGGADALVARLKTHGAAPVAHETFSIGDTNFNSQLLRIKAAQPDGVLIYGFTKEVAIILRQAKEVGLEATTILSQGTGGALFVELAKENAVGAYNVWYTGPVLDAPTTPVTQAFWAKFRARFPGYPPSVPNIVDMVSYQGATVFEEALKRAGRDLTRDKFIAAMESIKNFDASGLTNPTSFSPTDHQGARTVRVYQILPGGKTEFTDFLYTPSD
jgi:branched-chain amino acid transport system substrate-binding protein